MKKSILRVVSLFVLLLIPYGQSLNAQTATPPSGGGTSDDPYLIASLENLYWIALEVNDGKLSGAYFKQTANIDASETSEWFGGEGWVPIGNSWQDQTFEGFYDGGENQIYNLTINRPGDQFVGLFGVIMNSTLQNISLIDVDILGPYSGALAGNAILDNTIINCRSTGVLVGDGDHAGGLIGSLRDSHMVLCSSSVAVTGGLSAGGLCGTAQGSTITKSHSSGTVTGIYNVGGLVGQLYEGSNIISCFSTGDVIDGLNSGGFVGHAHGSGTLVRNSFSLGNVRGSSRSNLGGFCGDLNGAIIENSFSVGDVIYIDNTDPSDKGFIAADSGNTSGNFFDSETSNQSTGIGATPKTTAEMTRAGTFISEGWEFRESEQVWGFSGEDNGGYPFLRHQGYQPKDIWLGLTSDSWETTGNWSENTISTQAAIIPQIQEGNHTPIINAPFTAPTQIENLTIEANAQLAVAPGSALSVTGNFTNDAGPEGFRIQSDATGTGSLLHSSPGVLATVERHIQAADWNNGKDGWHFLSAPVNNTSIVGSDFVPDPESTEWGSPGNRTFDFYAFDESAAAQGEEPPLPWINIRNAQGNINTSFEANFINGKGYLVANKTTKVKAFQGELNQGTVQIPLSHTPDSEYSGWNLLGNPYPSAIRWDNSYSNQFVQNAVAIYDTNREGGAGYVYIQEGDYIPAHQGFFTEVKPDQHGQNFTLTNAMRAHGSDFMKGNTTTSELKAGNESVAETVSMGELSIRLVKDQFFDETKLLLHPGSSPDRDRYDALKLFSFHPGVPQVYLVTSDLVHMAVNAIPEICAETAIPLGFTVPEAGSYTIELGEASGAFAGHDIYLLDRQKNTQTQLSAGGQYMFAADPSDENHETKRFKILFSPSDATATSDPSAPNMHIYSSGQTIYVAFSQPEPGHTVEVYDLSGRLLLREAAGGSARFSTRLDVETGLYVVSVSGRESVQVSKVFIQ